MRPSKERRKRRHSTKTAADAASSEDDDDCCDEIHLDEEASSNCFYHPRHRRAPPKRRRRKREKRRKRKSTKWAVSPWRRTSRVSSTPFAFASRRIHWSRAENDRASPICWPTRQLPMSSSWWWTKSWRPRRRPKPPSSSWPSTRSTGAEDSPPLPVARGASPAPALSRPSPYGLYSPLMKRRKTRRM